MNDMHGVWPLIWERLVANWRLLSVLALGFLVAATLLALAPIYTRVMNDLGLGHQLEREIRVTRSSVSVFGQPLGSEAAAAEARSLAALMEEQLGWLTQSEVRYGGVTWMTLAYEGEPVPTFPLRRRIEIHTMSDLDDHVNLIDGRLAAPTTDPAQMEILVPAETARYIDAEVGDRLLAAILFDDCDRPPPTEDPVELELRRRLRCEPQVEVTLVAPFTIAGIIEKADEDDAYWGAGRISFSQPIETDTDPAIIPVVLPEETFTRALPLALPGMPSSFTLSSFADIGLLDSTNIDRVREDLSVLRARAHQRSALTDLSLERALASFDNRASFSQVSLLLLLLQVVGIALYYVVLVATMLVERRSEEIAMLRSRGASLGQIMATSLLEGVSLGVLALVLAPFLAAATISLLGLTPTFDDIADGGLLPYKVVPSAFAFAATGAALAFLALLVPTFVTARGAIVLYLQGVARPGKPFLQRYYIDVGVAGLAALALWELGQRETIYDPNSVGGWSADPLLILSPLLLIIAIGALLFRLLPVVTGLLGRIFGLTLGAGTTLGLWQLTRNPSRYTQLALLVVMAASVGTFAATYGTTTDRSQEERALYESGSDLRVDTLGRFASRRPAYIEESLTELDGVDRAAAFYRDELKLGPVGGLGASVEVLGVDPEQAPSLLWFREDFADEDLETLMARIQGSPSGGRGLALPGAPASVTAWVSPSAPNKNTTLWIRVLDGRGVFSLIELGRLDFEGYRALTAPITVFNPETQLPISLVSLIVTQAPGLREGSVESLVIDDITVRDSSGAVAVLEDFEGPFRWEPLRTATQNRDTFEQTTSDTHGGDSAGRYTFEIGKSVAVRGMMVSDPNIPVPAIASENLLRRAGVQVGDEIEVVVGQMAMPVSIRASAALFPTLGDPPRGFLILNQEHLYFFARLANQRVENYPTGAWLQLSDADPAAREQTIDVILGMTRASVSDVVDRQAVLDNVRADPVVRAGGSGILLLAVVAAMLLLAMGFSLTLYAGGRIRTLEVAVMRAVGFSRLQLFVMVALEYLVVAAVGLLVGTFAGLRISSTMLGFLGVTEDGERLVPPFALTTEWSTVAIAFFAVGLAFVAGIGALALYFLRMPVSRILRLTR